MRVLPRGLEGNRVAAHTGMTFGQHAEEFLSMLAAQGVHPKVMQELAGHSSSKVTMEIYAHINMDAKRGGAPIVQVR